LTLDVACGIGQPSVALKQIAKRIVAAAPRSSSIFTSHSFRFRTLLTEEGAERFELARAQGVGRILPRQSLTSSSLPMA
jgi:hypothetical protein